MIAQQKTDADKRRNRYTFIVDRRNPDNLNEKNIDRKPSSDFKKTWGDTIYLIGPKQYRDEENQKLCICKQKLKKVKQLNKINIKCAWCQKSIDTKQKGVYFCPRGKVSDHPSGYYLCSQQCEKARPNTYCRISPEWQIIPESCLGLSKMHLLYNPNYPSPVSIKLDDALNGYKFGFSYHILGQDNISTYWYYNSGVTVFELDDMKWAWSPWFDKINDKPQTLSQDTLNDITRCKKLPNVKFDEFERQSNELSC